MNLPFDLSYLVNEVLPQRYKEINEGKNDATRHPIYVVLDLRECAVEGHITHITPITNYKEKPLEIGYVERAQRGNDDDDEIDNDTFYTTDEGMLKPEEVTRFWVDSIVAFFLTKKDAEDYLKYQAHNLNEPYIYTFCMGYSNWHLDKLFDKEDTKSITEKSKNLKNIQQILLNSKNQGV